MFKDLLIVQIFSKGGLLMWPIFACSVVALAVAIERYRFFQRIALDTDAFMKRVKSSLAIRDYGDALRSCRGERHPVAFMVAAAIDHLNLGREALIGVMTQEALRQRHRLEHNLSALSTITAIAPLLGLGGTVTGMIAAFNVLGGGAIADPAGLANGIAEALYTTAAGLLVGIPALVVYNWAEARAQDIEAEMDHRALEMVNYVETAGVAHHVAAAA